MTTYEIEKLYDFEINEDFLYGDVESKGLITIFIQDKKSNNTFILKLDEEVLEIELYDNPTDYLMNKSVEETKFDFLDKESIIDYLLTR